MKKEVKFKLTLYDDESTREKLKVLDPIDIAYDDKRNYIPEEYWEIVDMKPGETITITIEKK